MATHTGGGRTPRRRPHTPTVGRGGSGGIKSTVFFLTHFYTNLRVSVLLLAELWDSVIRNGHDNTVNTDIKNYRLPLAALAAPAAHS